MAILDKQFNLTERTYDLNHGEVFSNQYFHWLMHMADYLKSSLGADHPKTQSYIQKAASQIDDMNWLTMEELGHYRKAHTDSYLYSLEKYLDAKDVPPGMANFILKSEDVAVISDLPRLIEDFAFLERIKRL